MANPKMKQLNINPAVTFPSVRGLLWDAFLIFLTFPPLTSQSVCPRASCWRSRLISVRCHFSPGHWSVLNPKAPCQELWEQNIYADWWILWPVLLQVFVERWHPNEREKSQQPSSLKQPCRNTTKRSIGPLGFISNQNFHFRQQLFHQPPSPVVQWLAHVASPRLKSCVLFGAGLRNHWHFQEVKLDCPKGDFSSPCSPQGLCSSGAKQSTGSLALQETEHPSATPH